MFIYYGLGWEWSLHVRISEARPESQSDTRYEMIKSAHTQSQTF